MVITYTFLKDMETRKIKGEKIEIDEDTKKEIHEYFIHKIKFLSSTKKIPDIYYLKQLIDAFYTASFLLVDISMYNAILSKLEYMEMIIELNFKIIQSEIKEELDMVVLNGV